MTRCGSAARLPAPPPAAKEPQRCRRCNPRAAPLRRSELLPLRRSELLPPPAAACLCRTFFKEPQLNLDFQFVGVADYAPYSFRRAAFMDIGGIDESGSEPGMCGILGDWEVGSLGAAGARLCWAGLGLGLQFGR
jgi:hypothetical protein